MNKLQLALLTLWANDAEHRCIKGRKRMQKVVYFLQQKGAPIDAEYSLHYYGPYSRDVANVTDVMVADGLLEEKPVEGQYEYRLKGATQELIDKARGSGSATLQAFENHRDAAIELLNKDLWVLELGSTILFCHRELNNWDRAFDEACHYKKAVPTHQSSKEALALAKNIAGGAS